MCLSSLILEFSMFKGQYVFSQITDHLPLHTFRRCVERYLGKWYVKHFKCYDQYLAMSFAQLTHRESLRDIEACLQAQSSKLYHIGFRSSISRSTLADANEPARLANLCRLCSNTNQDCSTSLCWRSTGIGSKKYCLCT